MSKRLPLKSEVNAAIALALELQKLCDKIERHFEQDCFADHLHAELAELRGIPDSLLEITVEALAPQNLDDVRRMPAPLHGSAVEKVLYSLDTTVEAEGPDNPAYRCMDWYKNILDIPGNLEAVIADSSVNDAEQLVVWLEAHAPTEWLDAEETEGRVQ